MAVPKSNQRAVNKYVKNNYDRINVTMPKGKKDMIQTKAEAVGLSVNAYINAAINEVMERDSSSSTVPMQASPQAPETPQDGLLMLVEIGYDPIAGKPLYSDKNTGKQYTVEAIPVSSELSEDITDDLPF